MTDTALLTGADGKDRCWWAGGDPDYLRYHDEEWGRPCRDDIRLYEKICLEGFQAGLSWLTILRKRENFRRAFAGFDFEKVACFTDQDVERLLRDEGIIRHRGKIEAAINNAQRTCDLIEECGLLYAYFERFRPLPENRPARVTLDFLKNNPQTPESAALSKDLKKRGFQFVGPVTMYAHMQAMGLVNDHLHGCCVRDVVESAQKDTR
jgi:DNA-3-methyladenine glycosylase I